VVGSPTSSSFTDTGLTNGTTYFYVVSAANASGTSGNSSEVNATPQATPPGPPTSLSVNPNKPGRLNLHWVQSTSSGVTQNGIYRRLSGGTYPSTATVKISAGTSYTDNGLSSRTSYCYVVTAFSGTGESVRSNESCATAK